MSDQNARLKRGSVARVEILGYLVVTLFRVVFLLFLSIGPALNANLANPYWALFVAGNLVVPVRFPAMQSSRHSNRIIWGGRIPSII